MRVHGDIKRIICLMSSSTRSRRGKEVMTADAAAKSRAGPVRWAKFDKKGDADLAYELNADSRFRCNLHRQLHGLGGMFPAHPEQDRHSRSNWAFRP